MKKENWTINTNKVRNWLETQDQCDETDAIEQVLKLGDNAINDDMRGAFWTSVRNIGSALEGFPLAQRGHQPSYSQETQILIANAEQTVKNAIATIPTEYHPMLLAVIVPHGRTGGVYATFDDLCEGLAHSGRNYMIKSMKDNRWNGEDNIEGVPTIVPVPTKADMEVGEEE